MPIRLSTLVHVRTGEATVFVVPGPGYGEADRRAVHDEYAMRAGGTLRFEVVEVDDLPLTGRGKFKFIEQLIPEEIQMKAVRE